MKSAQKHFIVYYQSMPTILGTIIHELSAMFCENIENTLFTIILGFCCSIVTINMHNTRYLLFSPFQITINEKFTKTLAYLSVDAYYVKTLTATEFFKILV